MRNYIFFFFFLFPFNILLGQKQGNIWYFGDHAGLDFNSGTPVFLNGGQTYLIGCPACHSEGTAVISDSSGSLLFYCDGQTIWNKNHQLLLNGDSLLGNISSTQSSLIVPLPGSSRYYYVFTTDAFLVSNLQYGLRYSIVDMCLDNGLGGVILGSKNILLLNYVAEKLTAVRHANNVDYWVISHKYNSSAFYSYHLTSSGITDTVVSYSGSVHPIVFISTGSAIGQLKASPNGEKLAIVNGNSSNSIAEYFDFDKATGVVSNPVSVQTNPVVNYYGVSFSPDNTKLYVSSCLNGNGLYQFDLTAGGGNPTSVIASKTTIASVMPTFALQLAVDGKIYVSSGSILSPYVSVINSPNSAGLSCNFVDSVIYLDGHIRSYGFPNFIDSYDYSNTVNPCVTGVEDRFELSKNIYPNPIQTKGILKFTYKSSQQTATFRLYDITSRVVFEKPLAPGSENQEINLPMLPAGFYLAEIQDGTRRSSAKVVVE